MIGELFELELLGGTTEQRFRKMRPEVEAMPWGTLDLSNASEEACIAARSVWTGAAYQEHRTALACAMTLRALIEARAPVDLIAVAAGFVLRAVGGAVATDVQMSKWFSLTISFASLFIVAGKRYAELRDLGDDARTRPTLDDYSLGFLRIVLSVSCGASLVTYCIWAFDTREAAYAAFGTADAPVNDKAVATIAEWVEGQSKQTAAR